MTLPYRWGDGEGMPSPYRGIGATVGRGLAPTAVFRIAKNRSPTVWAIGTGDPSPTDVSSRGCTVLSDRDGEGMPSPYRGIGTTVGRGLALALRMRDA